jgi:hypothetical protein
MANNLILRERQWIYLAMSLTVVSLLYYVSQQLDSGYRWKRSKGKTGKGATAKRRLKKDLGRGALPKKRSFHSRGGRFFK